VPDTSVISVQFGTGISTGSSARPARAGVGIAGQAPAQPCGAATACMRNTASADRFM
jgi:hypothetical protein